MPQNLLMVRKAERGLAYHGRSPFQLISVTLPAGASVMLCYASIVLQSWKQCLWHAFTFYCISQNFMAVDVNKV